MIYFVCTEQLLSSNTTKQIVTGVNLLSFLYFEYIKDVIIKMMIQQKMIEGRRITVPLNAANALLPTFSMERFGS
ncbi:hypothetical protein EB118_13460 [bacterium]|nr:hypothetical protein [bacterium]NDD84823.1 hypothetical protein [bacterium]NDG31060.1 hypothetical protein [bacterium]